MSGSAGACVAEMHTEAVATDAALRRLERGARDERAERGRSARASVPRSSHGELLLEGRANPLALLEEQALTRVPELVPVRYGRMLESPFAFFRGSALDHGVGPGADPAQRVRRAALR